jgi:DNA polymerase V
MYCAQILLPAPSPPRVPIPLASSAVRAGFPSPATDYIEKLLDLNELLIKRKESTFFMRVGGVSMVEFGINDRDLVVVDRAAPHANGSVVVARVDGELVLKKLHRRDGVVKLCAGNSAYRDIEFREGGAELEIWGVVTHVVHSF